MSARDYMAALDAYLDARDAYAEAVREHKMDRAIQTLSYEPGWPLHPDWSLKTRETERALATARCALEREVEALHGKP